MKKKLYKVTLKEFGTTEEIRYIATDDPKKIYDIKTRKEIFSVEFFDEIEIIDL